MNSDELLDTLSQRIQAHIPLTREFDFTLCDFKSGALSLLAPLANHVNDKGTFFAGSQAALFTLAGWALTTLEAEQHLSRVVDVVAVENQLKYTAPLKADIRICVVAQEDELQRFYDRLTLKGRARLSVQATAVGPDDQVIATWQGQYLARA